MSKFDFIPDRAIKNSSEDELNRLPFAKQLKESLSSWENEESLIIALKGKWGEGKSSVISLVKEQFEKNKENQDPTIIEFNPWAYSNNESLSYHFFNDIGNELKIKNAAKNDNKLAKKLKLYSQLINLKEETKVLKDIIPQIVLFFGILGISANKFFDWIHIDPKWFENTLFIFGLVILLAQLFSGVLNKIATFLELKSITKDTSPQSIKKEIISQLKSRKKKLLIIIDDTDRLSQKEICEIFKLIRVNADFPNTIYLLAFDSKIIEVNLEEQKGISGKDYLKKIVQVDFNLPYTKSDKVQQYLFKELDKLIAKLPSSTNRYFKPENPYWANTYHSGLKDFFINIRDVKRYINSLLFNINFLHREEVFEVNPIDFIALEALRVFTPDFYDFLKFRKELFTDSPDARSKTEAINKKRREEIIGGLEEVDADLRESVKSLITHLFPQLEIIINKVGGSIYADDFYATWRKELRICSKDFFDCYFTLIPEENESEFTQYDLSKFLESLKNYEDTIIKILDLFKNKKLRPLLRRIQDYTSDKSFISEPDSKNLMLALNNISDTATYEKESMFDFGISMDLLRVFYQLLSREEDKNKNFELIKEVIAESSGISGILNLVSVQTQGYEKDPNDRKQVFSIEHLKELQNIITQKIEKQDVDKLLNIEDFMLVLGRWRDWGDKEKLQSFIDKVKVNNSHFLKFLKYFILVSRSSTFGSYGESIHERFGFKNLDRYVKIDEVMSFVENISKESKEYGEFSSLIEMIKSDHKRYIQNPESYSKFEFDDD